MDVATKAVAGADVERNGLAGQLLGADLRVEDLGEAKCMGRVRRAIGRGCGTRCWCTDRGEGQILHQRLQQTQVLSEEALEDVVVFRIEQPLSLEPLPGRVGRTG